MVVERALVLKLWAFGVLGALFVLGYRRKLPDFVKLLGAVPAGLAIAAAIQVVEVWPPPASVRRRARRVARHRRRRRRPAHGPRPQEALERGGARDDEAVLQQQHVRVRLEGPTRRRGTSSRSPRPGCRIEVNRERERSPALSGDVRAQPTSA